MSSEQKPQQAGISSIAAGGATPSAHTRNHADNNTRLGLAFFRRLASGESLHVYEVPELVHHAAHSLSLMFFSVHVNHDVNSFYALTVV